LDERPLLPASRTYSDELEPVSHHLVAADLAKRIVDSGHGLHRRILYPTATHAAYVIVISRVAIETPLTAAHLKLLDETTVGEHLQVAIDGAQAHAGQTPPHERVDFVGSGVRSEPPQLLQDGLALRRHPELQAVV
jgi:hypothetical protein